MAPMWRAPDKHMVYIIAGDSDVSTHALVRQRYFVGYLGLQLR
jgi:hypothetical protein